MIEFREFDAAPGAAAVIRVDDGIAVGGKYLSGPAVVGHPAVRIVGLRPAVRNHDQGIAAALARLRMDQDRLEFQPVSGLVGNDFLPRQLAVGQPRVRIGQPERLGAVAQHVKLWRMFRCIRDRRHHVLARVAVHGADDRPRIRGCAGRFRLEHRCRCPVRVHAAIADPADGGVVGPDEIADVAEITRDEFPPLAPGR